MCCHAKTHGHFDHVGALASLVKEYPDVQVLFHEAEAPFLTGSADYRSVPSENPLYGKVNIGIPVQSALPPTRVVLLKGESGDIADAKGPSGQKTAWAIPRDIISFHRGHGHSPGHVSYLHKPSRSLIAGDVFGNWGQRPKIRTPPAVYTPNVTEAQLSLKRIAGLDFVKAYCAHDRLEGVTREALQQYTQTF